MRFVPIGNLAVCAARIVAVKIFGNCVIVYCDNNADYRMGFRTGVEAQEAYEALMKELEKN